MQAEFNQPCLCVYRLKHSLSIQDPVEAAFVVEEDVFLMNTQSAWWTWSVHAFQVSARRPLRVKVNCCAGHHKTQTGAAMATHESQHVTAAHQRAVDRCTALVCVSGHWWGPPS